MIRLGSTTHFSSPQHIYDWIFGKYEWGNEPTYTKVTWNCRNSIEGLNKPKINNCQLWRSLFPEACERLKVFFFFLSFRSCPFRYPEILVAGVDAEGKPLFLADIWLASSYYSTWNGSPPCSSACWDYGPFNIHLQMLGESEYKWW